MGPGHADGPFRSGVQSRGRLFERGGRMLGFSWSHRARHAPRLFSLDGIGERFRSSARSSQPSGAIPVVSYIRRRNLDGHHAGASCVRYDRLASCDPSRTKSVTNFHLHLQHLHTCMMPVDAHALLSSLNLHLGSSPLRHGRVCRVRGTTYSTPGEVEQPTMVAMSVLGLAAASVSTIPHWTPAGLPIVVRIMSGA